MQVAMLADIRIASDNSQFGIPAAKLGIAYGYDGLKHLVSLVGPSWARLLMYTGMRIDSAEALRIGLVDRVLPDTELWDATIEIAHTISGNAPLAIQGRQDHHRAGVEGREPARHGRDQGHRHRLHGLGRFPRGPAGIHGKEEAAVQGRNVGRCRRSLRIGTGPGKAHHRRDARKRKVAYNAAITAFAISAVPLLPPNSIGLMPSA